MIAGPRLSTSLSRLSSRGCISTSISKYVSQTSTFAESSKRRQIVTATSKQTSNRYPVRKATTVSSSIPNSSQSRTSPPPATSTTSSSPVPAPAPSPSSSNSPTQSNIPSTKSSFVPKPAQTTYNPSQPLHDLSHGLQDPLPAAPHTTHTEGNEPVDWSRSFHGLSTTAFTREQIDILMEPIKPAEVEVKPDGIIYLPEIKYRRILNRAFGPGAWGLAPRGETIVTQKSVTREFALIVFGRLVSIARGEQQYFDPEGIPTATEGCKSNALMRCCKDLGIASELWDPVFIRSFMANHAKDVWVEHMTTKRKKKIFMRKDVNSIPYPFVAAKAS